jgi:glycosyltransferase involved in cell wall biosynthesis
MGGVNVFLQQKLPWLAYTPRWLDSILNQPWLIRQLTRNVGKTSPKFLGALTVSMLQGVAGNQRKEFHRMLDWVEKDVRPEVIILTNLLIGGGIREIKSRTGSRVWVTLQGDDIFIESLPEPFRSQTISLLKQLVRDVDGFLIHSQDYASRMAAILSIPLEKIHVVPLGIATDDYRDQSLMARSGSSLRDTYRIGYLARMAEEKGLVRLVEAFIRIAKQPGLEHVELAMAGWMGPQHEESWQQLRSNLERAGLNDRWSYSGSVERSSKLSFLRSIDLFCVPTTYQEPKGLFVLEAVGCGVPYLQPAHGSFPEIHNRLRGVAPQIFKGTLFDPHSPTDLDQKLVEQVRQKSPLYDAPPELLQEIGIERHAERVVECLRR